MVAVVVGRVKDGLDTVGILVFDGSKLALLISKCDCENCSPYLSEYEVEAKPELRRVAEALEKTRG